MFPRDNFYFVKCTSPSFNKRPPQHDADAPVLRSWDAALKFASSPTPLFPPNVTMVIMAKQFSFTLIRSRHVSRT